MFITEAISYAKTMLSRFEAEILLSFILSLPREYFITHPEHKISKKHAAEFQKYCQARASGIPLAYLTHHKEFYGLDFYVDERVLIPRPETEMLVETAIKKLRITRYQLRITPLILDIGTGSGCIAVALAKHIPKAKIVAVDISEDALEVARKNAEFHGVFSQIEFIRSDLFYNLQSTTYNLAFDGIVANLPYIGTTEHHLVSKEVLEHEPQEALFAGENGLELYERLFSQIRGLSKPPKWFIGEMGFLQQKMLEKLIRKYFGTISVTFKNDLSGFPRMFSISFNKSASLPACRQARRSA